MSDDSRFDFSRRKLLGSVATIGAAGAIGGASTTALLWDEEKFGNQSNPNILQAGELDLKVDWEGRYYNWIGETGYQSFSSDGEVDQPGPIITLEDVKPGDVIEVTQSAHIYGNPAFLGWHYEEHEDTDNAGVENENMTEPEDKVNGHPLDQSDGTDGDGDLDEYMEVLIWYDDGDNLIDEVWEGVDDTGGEEGGEDGELDGSLKEYVMDIAEVQDAASEFGGMDGVVYAGSLAGLDGANVRFDARDSVSGQVAEDFPESACYQNSVTEYIGFLAWLPRDLPGVNDNIIQGDRLEFQFGFDAIQCRHNVDSETGDPINGTISSADNESNPVSPE